MANNRVSNSTAVDYKTLLTKSEDKIKSEEIEDRVEEAYIRIQSDIFGAKTQKKVAEKAFKTALSSSPLNTNRILETKFNVAQSAETISELEELKAQLFPGRA